MVISMRQLSAPGISIFINAICIFFLCANLIQNHVLVHKQAVGQHTIMTAPSNIDMDMPWHLPQSSKTKTKKKQKRQNTEEENDGDSNTNIGSFESYDTKSAISMTIPRGKAVAMPSVQISEEEEKQIKRDQYGGKGDKPHLGGFTDFDPLGVSPSLWKHLVSNIGVKSVLDVGCGKGVSTSWFVTHDLDFVQCVEGSHDAVTQSIVPNSKEHVVEHDFSRGPWWPDRTVDAAWCVEFTEHVGRNYQPYYLPAFRKAALVFVTHSNWGGWHHVEVHDDAWWQMRWEAAGFVYSDYLTQQARKIALRDQHLKNLTLNMDQDHLYFVGQHIYLNIQVFINPMVASLPEHAHLFAEHGCFAGKDSDNKQIHVDCSDTKKAKGEVLTPLPESFKPLKLTADMDKQWFDLIKDFKAGGRLVSGKKNKKKG